MSFIFSLKCKVVIKKKKKTKSCYWNLRYTLRFILKSFNYKVTQITQKGNYFQRHANIKEGEENLEYI